jgi:hypothetical protein
MSKPYSGSANNFLDFLYIHIAGLNPLLYSDCGGNTRSLSIY